MNKKDKQEAAELLDLTKVEHKILYKEIKASSMAMAYLLIDLQDMIIHENKSEPPEELKKANFVKYLGSLLVEQSTQNTTSSIKTPFIFSERRHVKKKTTIADKHAIEGFTRMTEGLRIFPEWLVKVLANEWLDILLNPSSDYFDPRFQSIKNFNVFKQFEQWYIKMNPKEWLSGLMDTTISNFKTKRDLEQWIKAQEIEHHKKLGAIDDILHLLLDKNLRTLSLEERQTLLIEKLTATHNRYAAIQSAWIKEATKLLPKRYEAKTVKTKRKELKEIEDECSYYTYAFNQFLKHITNTPLELPTSLKWKEFYVSYIKTLHYLHGICAFKLRSLVDHSCKTCNNLACLIRNIGESQKDRRIFIESKCAHSKCAHSKTITKHNKE